MKRLEIQFSNLLNDLNAQSASQFFCNIKENNAIDNVNWPSEYPYQPEAHFKIARSNDSLYIHFQVVEKNLRALYLNDQEPVWEDSCVEFFCQIPDSETYMNFEFNCIGTCVATTRKGKEIDVVQFSSLQMAQIDRFSSLDRLAFNEMKGNNKWELTIKIPFTLLGIDALNLPEKLLGNFYKCADGTASPHYLSWSPIPVAFPNFHLPEHFGVFYFD